MAIAEQIAISKQDAVRKAFQVFDMVQCKETGYCPDVDEIARVFRLEDLIFFYQIFNIDGEPVPKFFIHATMYRAALEVLVEKSNGSVDSEFPARFEKILSGFLLSHSFLFV